MLCLAIESDPSALRRMRFAANGRAHTPYYCTAGTTTTRRRARVLTGPWWRCRPPKTWRSRRWGCPAFDQSTLACLLQQSTAPGDPPWHVVSSAQSTLSSFTHAGPSRTMTGRSTPTRRSWTLVAAWAACCPSCCCSTLGCEAFCLTGAVRGAGPHMLARILFDRCCGRRRPTHLS